MKKNLINKCLPLLFVIVWACTQPHTHSEVYTCPMHPEVRSEVQGVCPVCQMDLVPLQAKENALTLTPEIIKLAQLPASGTFGNQATIRVTYAPQSNKVAVTGIVTYDQASATAISLKYAGRLEASNLRYWYQPVKKGQLLGEFYSPEIQQIQQNYLVAVQNNQPALANQQLQQLQLAGMAEEQLNELRASQVVSPALRIYSPATGYIIPPLQNRDAQPVSEMNLMETTNPTPSFPENLPSELPRSGQYLNAGAEWIQIIPKTSMRIDFRIPQRLTTVTAGDTIRYGHNQIGLIRNLQPLDQADQMIIARVYINNDSYKPGKQINGTLTSYQKAGFLVPRSAVLDLGTRTIVFRKDGQVFRPVVVKTGLVIGDQIQIQSGLLSSDLIARNAAFFVDTDSTIKPIQE